MMSEKQAAIDEYKRREQACQDKWEENPEAVPEECWCTEDIIEEPSNAAQLSSPPPVRFGEDQASLGLDRYSVGYDLPLPPMRGSATASAGGDSAAAKAVAAGAAGGGSGGVFRVVEEVGDLLVETLADLTRDGEAAAAEFAESRNETTSSAPPSSVST